MKEGDRLSIYSINIILENLANTLSKTQKLQTLEKLWYEESMPNRIHARYSDDSTHQISVTTVEDSFKLIVEIVKFYTNYLEVHH